MNRFQGDAVKTREGIVICIVRLYDDNLVTFIGHNLHSHGESLASSHVNHNLRELDINAYLLVVLVNHSLPELGETERIGI